MHDFKKLLQYIPTNHKEYYFPDNVCSLFLMPDGWMFGTSKLIDHVSVLEPILEKRFQRKIL